jgi:hypothetical protein
VPKGNLFVVYDQAKARPSTSPHGRYLMHLRWHFPNVPKLKGKQVTVTQGASRLVLNTVLPSNAAMSVVDERHNPDGNDCSGSPCTICEQGIDGVSSACQPFGDSVNAGTERVEVRTPGNPLAQEFLTAMQAGPKSLKPMKTTLVSAADGSMKGVQVVPAGGKATVVLFNARAGAAPRPITSVSYSAAKGQQVLTGMTPGARYDAARSGTTVTVTQRDARIHGLVRRRPAVGCLEPEQGVEPLARLRDAEVRAGPLPRPFAQAPAEAGVGQ